MTISFGIKRLFALLFVALLALVPSAIAATPNHLVISQIYGGGGNSGALYTYDFVELYNPTASAISLNGYSFQYASSAGTSWSMVALPTTDSVQPGHYYLIQLASQSTSVGGPLPTPDFVTTGDSYISGGATKTSSSPINMSASTGNVVLSSATDIYTACPAANVVDQVAFGTGACPEGADASNSGYTNSSSYQRSPVTSDTNNNVTDFALAATATPHNSSYSSTALAVASATATPSSLLAGASTVLSVTVTPGLTSTGIAVKADLSSIGGGAAQAFALGGTPNTYTYTLNVGGSVAAKTYTLPVTVTDAETGNASGSINLTVQAPVTAIPIPTLQGNRSTYVGTKVTTTGVVTSLLYNGFFIQLPSSKPGSTGVAEGMDIYTSSAPTVAVGDDITVTGSLQLYPAATASVTPALELTSPAITTNSKGNPLPTPIALTSANLVPSGGLQQLTRYEGMRVSFASLTSISGTGGGTLDEVNEIYPSNGQFYATITGTPRPFREPGIDVRDAAAATAPNTIPRFDDNPERILVDTYVGLNATAFDVSTGATFANLTGVLDFTYSNDSYYDPSRFIPDAATIAPGYKPGMTVQALPLPSAGQFTVGAYNIERFFNTTAADNLDFYPVTGKVETSEAVNVTAAAYTRRLAKVSLAIRHVINNPDILALEEEENGFVLKDIAAQISSDAIAAGEPDPKYVAYGTDNATFYSNDESGISVGFLVKSTVDFISLDQFFNKSVFTPTGGKPTTTDDRPPFVLHAGIKRGDGIKDYPLTVIVNHMKALPDDTVAVQQKKELQAEELAGLIQGYQANGEHVLAVGDFNAFEFSDGYIDELGTVTNRTVPANTVIQPGKPGLVTPPATDLALNIAAAQRYSYNEDGNAQVLDHVVVTNDLAGTTTLAYGRVDSDFPLTAYNDATTPARVSDHDPALAYLALPAPVTTGTLTGIAAFPNTVLGASSSGQGFTLTNTGETVITIASIATTGDFAQSNNCGTSLAVGATCAINVVFTPTVAGSRTGTLAVNSNATITPASLTGTGVPMPTFTIADNSANGGSTTTITVAAGTSSTGSLKFTSVTGYAGSIALTCAAQGTAPTGTTCTVTSPVTLTAGNTATATITITTTARTVATLGFGSLPRNGRMLYTLLMILLAGAAFTLRHAGRNLRTGSLLALLFITAIGITGCSSSNLNTSANPNGTPNGTYNYTVTATSGGMTKTQAIVVIVQ